MIQKLDLVTVRHDMKVVRKVFEFSGMAFDGEDNSLEMIVLASATYAIFKLKGPATAAVWGSFHSAKKHCEMIDQPSVEVYP